MLKVVASTRQILRGDELELDDLISGAIDETKSLF